MKTPLLRIANLRVSVEDRPVIAGLDLEIKTGEIVVLHGANGSGKSSLAMTIMGNQEYRISNIEEAQVTFEGKDLLEMSIDERARAGIFVAWQNPIQIAGVSVFNLCKSSYEACGGKIEKLTDFKLKLETLAERVGLSKEHVGRNAHEGFSGGEKKRLEMLQLLLLAPKLAVLDEIDSGLDSDGVKRLIGIIKEMSEQGTSFVLITHNKKLLEGVEIDHTWEMRHGQLQTRV